MRSDKLDAAPATALSEGCRKLLRGCSPIGVKGALQLVEGDRNRDDLRNDARTEREIDPARECSHVDYLGRWDEAEPPRVFLTLGDVGGPARQRLMSRDIEILQGRVE